MRKFKVLDFIEYDNKYIIPGDILILVSEFNGGSGRTSCTVSSKTFCNMLTREKVRVIVNEFNKIEEIV